jgi:Fic family protein
MALSEETPARMEPCLLDESSPAILDLVASLSGATHALGARLHPKSAAGLAELVLVMNCYYSNLIEGHNTTPREIERALQNRLDPAEERRNLQIEARAHIRVQREIDRLHAAGVLPEPASVMFICWLHRSFYEDAPEAMLRVEGKGRTLRVTPGAFRSQPEEDVEVGRHLPPASDRVEAFMAHFEWRYGFAKLGMGSRIMACQPSDEPCHGACVRYWGAWPLVGVQRSRARPDKPQRL